MQPGASLSEVARRYGIAARVLFRWKQEMMPAAAPTFVAVEITDLPGSLAAHVFGSTKLFADDTPIPVLDPGRGRTKTGLCVPKTQTRT